MRKVSYLARARRSLESTRVPSISEDDDTELRNQAALRLEADELLFLLGTFFLVFLLDPQARTVTLIFGGR